MVRDDVRDRTCPTLYGTVSAVVCRREGAFPDRRRLSRSRLWPRSKIVLGVRHLSSSSRIRTVLHARETTDSLGGSGSRSRWASAMGFSFPISLRLTHAAVGHVRATA